MTLAGDTPVWEAESVLPTMEEVAGSPMQSPRSVAD
jgi:hypothetical protein